MYDIRFKGSKTTGNKEYEVTIEVSTINFYADSTVKETATKMNDYIDIGIFGDENTDKNGRKQTKPLSI